MYNHGSGRTPTLVKRFENAHPPRRCQEQVPRTRTRNRPAARDAARAASDAPRRPRRPRKPNVTETYRANSSFPLGSAAALSGL